MPLGLAVLVGILAMLWLPLAYLIAAVTLWVFEGAITLVRPWPLIGDRIANLFSVWEVSFFNLASQAVARATQLIDFAQRRLTESIAAIARVMLGLIPELVTGLRGDVNVLLGVVSLAVLPPVERELPVWLKELERAAKDLPNEPAFRSGGPVALLLRWVGLIWAVVSKLGPFVRLVALPLLLIVGALWAIIETIGRITRLETIVTGLTGYVENLNVFRQADEAAIGMLVVTVNGLILHAQQLQVDLEKERAARVALATQTQQALDASTRLQDARYGQLGSQLNPLLALTVLGLLGGSAIDVLRKTAQCDPCAQLDQLQPDFEERISALETFGE